MELLTLITLLVCNVGGPGNAAQAQPVLDRFLRHLERSGGFASGELRGIYATDLASCQAAIKAHHPRIIVSDLPTLLAEGSRWKLGAVAHMGGPKAKRYTLLVRKGHSGGLNSLAGKLLIAPLARDPRFLRQIVLDGKVPAAHFQLKATSQPLRGLRMVARGRGAATVVDEQALHYLKELSLPKALVPLHQSAKLPGLTLSVVGSGRPAARLKRKLQRALPALCSGAGLELCKTFGVSAFVAADLAALKRLARRYAQGG